MTHAQIPDGFVGEARRIQDDRPWLRTAEALGCDVAALRAVAEVEARGAPFLEDGRPPILFERHVFSRRTEGAHDAAHPELSASEPGGYRGGPAEYDRLSAAIALDRAAALESASWGKFQIMGFNSGLSGYASVEAFVADMCQSEARQLAAFASFVAARRLDRFLRTRDWAAFARGYNGPAYRRNRYDERMREAYRRHAGRRAQGDGDAFRVETLHDLQVALNFLGAEAGPADGLMGPRTRAAILRFQAQCRLARTGRASPALMQAVQAVFFAMGGERAAEASARTL